MAQGSDCTATSSGFVPLSDLGTDLYLGQFQGGLYPDGSNQLPPEHHAAGLAAAAAIGPRDPTGAPDPTGKIVLISVGMSNTAMEFCTANPDAGACAQGSFMAQAAASLAVDHQTLVLVNGAKSAEPAPAWLDPAGANYVRLAGLLAAQGLSEMQVQIAWVKQANPVPSTALPAAGADAYLLEAELGTIARALKSRYPNLQQVFFSSRIYAGYATADLNPEPYAYEAGFAVKWLIEAQVRQMASPGQPVDPIAGDLDYGSVAPWIAWGPYLWADGTTPRSDGLFYACNDLLSDGTHPSNDGIAKVSGLLLDFFLGSDVTASWFASGSTTTTTLPSCPPQPSAGCSSGRAHALFRRGDQAETDRFRWRWLSASVTSEPDFGNPTTATSYRLCMYDATRLALEAIVPARANCAGAACWRARQNGFRYRDPQRGRAGLSKILLSWNESGHTRIGVTGKGANLPLPPMPVAVPVHLQLAAGATGPCWDATFAAPLQNDTRQFRATSSE